MINSILVTGAAGFIGAFLSARLVREGWNVTGLDNVNAYYDPGIKEDRICMVEAAAVEGPGSFRLVRGDLADAALIERLFAEGQF